MQPLMLLASLVSTTPAPPPPAPRAFIVIAAVDNYADKEIPSRSHAETDARALHSLLADRRHLGAVKEQMRLLTGRDVTRHKLLDSMRWLRDSAGPDDLVLFAFFGQGATLDERRGQIAYLASDSTLAGRARNAICAAEIADVIDQLRSRRVCVLLDVPFVGFRTNRPIAAPDPGRQRYREFTGDVGTAEHCPLPDRLVIAREGRLGPMVVKALRGAADTGDGVVTSAELVQYLKKHLIKEAELFDDFEMQAKGSVGTNYILHGDGAPFPITYNPAVKRTAVATNALPRDEATKFAKAVLRICDNIRDGHVLEPKTSDLLEHGITGLYQRLREPVPDDVLRKLRQLANLTAAGQRELLSDIRQQLGQRDELGNATDIRWTIQEMLWKLDRFSNFSQDGNVCILRPQHVGIGVVLRKSAASGYLEVVTPLPRSPAHKAGVMAGDIITAVTQPTGRDGERLESPDIRATQELSVISGAWLLAGKKGTSVRLTIRRTGEERTEEIEVIRGDCSSETIYGRRRNRDGSWNYWLDEKKKIAYVRIGEFGRDTAQGFRNICQKLHKEKVQGVVLDLRFSSGGLFNSTSELAGILLEPGGNKERTVVTIKAKEGRPDELRCRPENVLQGTPLVVLVNGTTAGGAEILAACLQDYKRASIVGERTAGQGGVQNVQCTDGAELTVTFAMFVRPGGKGLQGWRHGEGGVTPDQDLAVTLSTRDRLEIYRRIRNSEILSRADRPLVDPFDGFKDVQLEKALAHLGRAAE